MTSDGWSVPAWAAIGVTGTAAVVFGVSRNRPRLRAPWLFIAGALASSTVGDAAFGQSVIQSKGLPILASICYCATLPLVLIGLTMLTRASVALNDRSRLLDLLAVLCAAAMAAWVFLIGPSLTEAGLSGDDRAILALCVVGDLLVLVVMVRLVVTARSSPCVVLLAAGSFASLAGDVAYGVLQVHGSWYPGGISEFCYLVFYACSGAGALHPSMVALTERVGVGLPEHARIRTALLRVALVVPALAVLVEIATGRIHDLMVIAVGVIIIGHIVVTRLSDTVERHRQAVERERVLRESCGELATAVDGEGAAEAVRRAIGRLMPPGARHAVVIALSGKGSDTATGEAVSCRPDAAFSRPDAAFSRPDAAFSRPDEPALRRTRLVSTGSLDLGLLDPAWRDQLAEHDAVLICPLLSGLPQAVAGAGQLCIGSIHQVLDAMRDTVEVLAAQLALAVERIELTDAINRRDGDRYLRTVIRNATDIVCVLDEDFRIRYVSPLLATVLGVESTACG
ncbi:MAG: hypothetical protein JXA67_04180, partial [Micromonosporaceae bacterium]|nr:hypothetical protein [Micromonosporaceae bacterium]